MRVYQIILKRKSSSKQEIVGQTLDREEAHSLRDYWNEQEENEDIYYLVMSTVVPKAKVKRWRKP